MKTTTLDKRVEKEIKSTEGVELHGSKLRIVFRFKGKRCREIYPTLKLNIQAVREARIKRDRILEDIAAGTFVYSAHFPESNNALAFDEGNGKIRLVRDAADMFLKLKSNTLAPKTVEEYGKKIRRHILPQWGEQWMHKIKPSAVEAWQFDLLNGAASTTTKPLAEKTIHELFSIMRQMFDTAVRDECAPRNVFNLVKMVEKPEKTNDDIQPFTMEELAQLDATATDRQSEKNMILFNAWVGLSASELCALAWEDIDMENWTASVKRALVGKEFKCPKERYRRRIVDIPAQARPYLIAQQAISRLLPAIDVPVRQFNNRQIITESISIVFVNSNTQRHWDEPSNVNLRFMHDFLSKAGVAYRPMNQSRHTFACRMLTLDMDRGWIIRQLGHRDQTMLIRHYGKYIDAEHVNRSDEVSRRLSDWMQAQGSS